MLKHLAYKIVFKDLLRLNLFCGVYDATNGNDKFMYGVWMVMEHIAYMADENKVGDFNALFAENMEKSEEKTEREGE